MKYSEPELVAFGGRLAEALRGGEVIELVGDLGAGKTTLTRAIARGLGITETIHSPTFTIENRYDVAGGKQLAHYDFYRLPDPGIMADELREAMSDPKTITIIEWADAVKDVLPADRLTVMLTAADELSRNIELIAHGENSQALKEKLQ